MPQKKNADSLELIRGKSGRIFGRVSERKINSLTCFLLESFLYEFKKIFRYFFHVATSF